MWQKISTTIVYSLFIISVALIALSIFALLFGKATAVGTATIIAAAAAAMSVVYLAEQVRVSSEQEKVNRSWYCIKMYSDPAFREVASPGSGFFRQADISEQDKLYVLLERDGEKLEDKVRALNIDQNLLKLNQKIRYWLSVKPNEEISTAHIIDFRARVSFFFNFFETVSLLYMKNHLDKKLIDDFFEEISPSVHKRVEFYVKKLGAERGQKNILAQWESMNREIKKHR